MLLTGCTKDRNATKKVGLKTGQVRACYPPPTSRPVGPGVQVHPEVRRECTCHVRVSRSWHRSWLSCQTIPRNGARRCCFENAIFRQTQSWLRVRHRGLWWQLPSKASFLGVSQCGLPLSGFFKTFTISTLKTSKIKFYFVVISKVDRHGSDVPFSCTAENVHNHFIEITPFL